MAFIKKISDYITSHYDLTKENITIVFPNKRAALQLRTELAKTIKTNFWVPQIVSIQQAMEEWSGLQLIDNIEVIFEIIKMNQEFFPYAAQMAKDFDEIDQYGVNAEKLFAHLKDAKEIEEWNLKLENGVESNYLKFFASLLSYYNNLRDTLQKNGQGYYGLITNKIAAFDDATLNKHTQGRKIIFAGFNALTRTEENIIVRMVESGNAVMLWDLDRYYFEDEKQEAGHFARKFFQKHPNIEKNFIGDNYLTQEKHINIISVSGNAVQTNALQLALQKDKNKEDKEDKKNKKSVIVLADESLLIPVLNSIPETFDQIQVTMGYPFDKTTIYHFVDQLFRYQNTLSEDEDKIYLWTFLRFCNSDFIKLIFKGLEYNNLNSWLMDMAKNSIYYFKKSDLKQFEKFPQLFDFLNLTTKKWENAKNCVNSLKEILLVSIAKVNKNDNFVKNQISVAGRIANRLELLLNKYSEYIKIIDLQMLYAQVAGQMSLNLQGDKDGLQIMGLLETRNLDFDVIHFLSVNEGILPQNKNNNSLIPFDLRKAYGLPTYDQQQAVYAYHFYRLLQNAKDINLYYNNIADLSGMGEPSRFIRQLEYEYAKNNDKVKLEHWQYKSPSINEKQGNIKVAKTDQMLEKIHSLSPSSIGVYVRCPLQYYWKKVENIEDKTPDEEIQMNVIGNIVHKTLDYFYKLFDKNEIISPTLFDKIYKKHFKECYHKSLIDNGFANGLPATGFNYLNKTVIDNMLEGFINSERTFLEKGNQLSIIDTEKELEKVIDIQGHKVRLHGFADRIDRVNDAIRVIDYKTGKVNPYDVKINDKVVGITSMAEKAIQLLMYKYLYLHNNPGVKSETIQPGIVGFQKLSHGLYNLEINELHDLSTSFKETCDKYFNEFLEDLFNKDIPFTQTEDDNNCSFCDFKSICKRG